MRKLIATALSSLTLVACGTTVPLTGAAPGSDGLGDSTGQTPAAASDMQAGSSSGAAAPGAASTSGGTSAGSPGSLAPGQQSQQHGQHGPTSSIQAPLGERSAIEIGFAVSQDAGKAFASLGYGGLSTGDGAKQTQAVVGLINAAGGLAGHPIKPVIFETDPSGSASQFQTACSLFFDDHHVRAVLEITLNDVIMGCAKQHGVPLVAAGGISTSEKTLAANPHTALPNQMSVDEAATQLVNGLVRQGWFKPSSPAEAVKIGLVTHDDPQYAGVPTIVAARLKAAGLTLADTAYQPYPHGSGDTATASSAGRSNVFKFQSESINRVLVVDAGGFGMSWFGISAATQSYYPRFGLTTLSEPSLEPAVLTPRQLSGSAGIGWVPVLDTSVAMQPAISPRTTTCLTAMKKAGEDTSLAAERVAAESLCEAGFTLLDAWSHARPDLTSFQRGLATLGSNYRPVSVFGADFRRSRAAAQKYRAIQYDAGCDCYRYAGAVAGLS